MKANCYYLTLAFMLVLGLNYGYTQAPTLGQNTNSIYNQSPASPTVSELGKYGEMPVSLFTGIPDISIPLYNIELDGNNLPITLNYHASGIKVNQIASWVGLGWSLNAGGVITRVVRGLPDEINGIGYVKGGGQKCLEDLGGITSTLTSTLNNDEFVTLYDLANGTIDGEPDDYFFNFSNISGRFNFDEIGNIHFLEQTNFKISYERNNMNTFGQCNHIIKFVITTDEGIKYYFGTNNNVETVSSQIDKFVRVSETQYCDDDVYLPYKYGGIHLNIINRFHYSTWFLDRIEYPNTTNTIDFDYEIEPLYYYLSSSENYCIDECEDCTIYNNKVIQRTNSFIEIDSRRLLSISWNTGFILFEPQAVDREDINDISNKKGKALSKIKIYSMENQMVPVKEIEFMTDYFGSNYSCTEFNSYPSYFKRLRLNSIIDGDKKTSFYYNCTYDGPIQLPNDFNLPSRNSLQTDYWGFYKKNNSKILKPNVWVYPKNVNENTYNAQMRNYKSVYSIFPSPLGGGIYINDGVSKDADINVDPNYNPANLSVYSLNKIVYPTMGYTEFIYEPNEFMIPYIVAEPTNPTTIIEQYHIGGGQRIKTIINYDGVSHDNDIVKQYVYTQNSLNTGLSSGKITVVPDFAKQNPTVLKNALWNFECPNPTDDCKQRTIVSRFCESLTGLGSTFGSHVGYEKVTVKENGNGKVVSIFEFSNSFNQPFMCANYAVPDIYDSRYIHDEIIQIPGILSVNSYKELVPADHNFPYLNEPDYNWSRGKIKEKLTYNNNDQLVGKTLFTYAYKWDPTFMHFFKAGINYTETRKWTVECPPHSVAPECEGYAIDLDLFLYDIKLKASVQYCGYKYLTQEESYTIPLNTTIPPITSSTQLIYNEENYIKEKITTFGNGDVHSHKFIYPSDLDINFETWFNINAISIREMRLMNMINTPLETVKLVNNKVVNAELRTFKYITLPSNPYLLILPDKDYKLELSNSVDNFEYCSIDIGHPYTFLHDQRYFPEVIFDEYDNTGKLIKFHKNSDIKTSVIYGYSNSIPIAIVKNANENEIGYSSFETINNDGWSNVLLKQQRTNVDDTHCGTLCAKVEDGFGPTKSFYFDPTNFDSFIASVWVKGSTNGYLRIQVNDEWASKVEVSVPTGSDINKWQLLSVVMPKEIVSQYKGTGSNPFIKVYCGTTNQNGNPTYFDDIRFHPINAQMTTYTFQPLVGMTSETDANNKVKYYEYDVFNRLKLTRDQNYQILNKIDYHYKSN